MSNKKRNNIPRGNGNVQSFSGLPSFTDADLEDEQISDDVEELDDDYDDDEFEDDDDEPEDEIPVDENAPDNSKLLSFDEEIDEGEYEEKVRIPEWNSYVMIRGLTKPEFDDIRRKTRVRTASGGRNGKRPGMKSGVNRALMDREVFITGVISPEIDVPKYNILVERPGSAGVVLNIVKRILEKSGFGDDETDAEENREKRFPRKR